MKALKEFACGRELARLWRSRDVSCYTHQVEAARRAIDELGGRAILADEVGLGKTIEGGLVIRELLARGRIERYLVLCPASLVAQWQQELEEKFALPAGINPRRREGWLAQGVVASIDRAKREPARSLLIGRPPDLLVVDEAHRLKNQQTENHRLVRAMAPTYLLLLSATPLQNDLEELYNLASLCRPELFPTFDAFSRRFLLDRRTPRDPAGLADFLAQVLIRHRREETELTLPERRAALLPIDLLPDEQALYEAVTAVLQEAYLRRRRTRKNILPLLMLKRQICSSSFAVAESLTRRDGEAGWLAGKREGLLRMADGIDENAKAGILESLLIEIKGKAIIFTEFRATQNYLLRRLRAAGVRSVPFHGGMSLKQKEEARERFAAWGDALVSTQCGGEGLNFQFCRHVVNYDLPWNPMRIEQRIGRVHRIGQEHPVNIYNLCARGTVEEYVLRLLDEKIDLFRQVIGGLDIIIRQLERKRSFESTLLDISLTSRSAGELERRFNLLGNQLVRARRRRRRGFLSLAGERSGAAHGENQRDN